MRLLVIEDELPLLENIMQAFREDGYAVDGAATGTEGLYKAKTWDYDAIILDVMLPELDGWKLLSQLRTLKSTPVLMLTARDTIDDRVKGLDTGADDYLVKPFSLKELLARVRALIRRSVGKSDPVITSGELTLNTQSKTIAVKGKPIKVTSLEYHLVEMLMLHRGEVISRTQLYDHLFDEEEDSMSNLLDVHVSNIRKKLGKDMIQTRRGLGYIIE